MNGLKVGDKVVCISKSGIVVKATVTGFGKAKYPETFPIDVVYEDGRTNSYKAEPNLVVLEDVYNSPLYKALS